MNRRDFLKTAAVGLAAASQLPVPFASAQVPGRTLIELSMTEALVEMVDETPVYSWVYGGPDTPRFPGPVITVTEGQRIQLKLSNQLPVNSSFNIPGVTFSGSIRPGRERNLFFNAPPAGTYIYYDSLNGPINRVMGLHGVLVSLPAGVSNNPYSRPTPQVRQLFDDLGTHEAFPGHPWHPDKTVIWVFHTIDPEINDRIFEGESLTGLQFAAESVPRYFTLNGRSGFFAAHAHDTHLHSTVGHPHLIRSVATGLWGHSPHTHANHVYVCAVNGLVQSNVFLIDTWTIKPLERIDVVFPFIKPPDIPDDTWQKCIAGTQEEPFPMMYPMHDHSEPSQTAGGGNYPHGAMTHIDFLGPLDQIGTPGNPPDGLPSSGGDHDHEDDEE